MRNKVILLTILSLVYVASGLTAQSRDSVHFARGKEFMAREEWQAASEALLECLAVNPVHAEGSAALAEVYYEMGELDEALIFVNKAKSLARTNMAVYNLEAYILIAQGKAAEAGRVLSNILKTEPYNKEAIFVAAELDIANGS
jgi:tetratricopeptide (TPR) repeat protein